MLALYFNPSSASSLKSNKEPTIEELVEKAKVSDRKKFLVYLLSARKFYNHSSYLEAKKYYELATKVNNHA